MMSLLCHCFSIMMSRTSLSEQRECLFAVERGGEKGEDNGVGSVCMCVGGGGEGWDCNVNAMKANDFVMLLSFSNVESGIMILRQALSSQGNGVLVTS